MKSRKLVIFAIAFSVLTGGVVAQANQVAKSTHYEGSMKAIPHQTITFDSGSSTLTDADRESLRKLIREAKLKGTIEQVTVAAWSDKALPKRGQKLSDFDRTLAERRANAIENFLETDLLVDDVDTYNMAETANWVARTFDTREAELKSMFGRRGADLPVTNAEFQVIKNEGGPAEAVVLVEMEMPSSK